MPTLALDALPLLSQSARSRAEQAYDKLKRLILDNSLRPGFEGTEPALADRLGMSRTPVREAMLRLEADGLVRIRPRHGMRVLPVAAEDLREIFEVLIGLEPEASAMLASRGLGQEEREALERALEAMRRSLICGDRRAWADADDGFHMRILTASGNGRLASLAEMSRDQRHRANLATLAFRNDFGQSNDEHEELLEMLLVGDVAGARSLHRSHLEREQRSIHFAAKASGGEHF